MNRFDVTIAGEINLDLILYGLPQDMPLERELLATDFRLTLGSSSAILAHNLSVLGTKVGFITLVGSDALGAISLERLRESGVDLERVVHAGGTAATGITLLLPHDAGRHILTYPGTMARMTGTDLDLEYLASSRHFHLSSLFLQRALQPDLPRIFRELKRAGLTISLDTNDDPEDRWAGVLEEILPLVDVLLPNATEACRIAGRDRLDDALQVLSKRVPLVVVKCGAEGAVLQQGDTRTIVKAIASTPVDTIGAGDSFNAGFLYAYCRGANAAECARAGNIAGALSTLRSGGTEAFREPAFYRAFLAQHNFPRGSFDR